MGSIGDPQDLFGAPSLEAPPKVTSKAIRARLLSAGAGGGLASAVLYALTDYDITVGPGLTGLIVLLNCIVFGYAHRDRPTGG